MGIYPSKKKKKPLPSLTTIIKSSFILKVEISNKYIESQYNAIDTSTILSN